VQVRVEIDTSTVAALMDALRAPAFHEVAALALNDTVKNAQVETAQIVAPMMGLPSRVVKDALSIEVARPDHLEAALVGRGKAIKMIEFGPRATRQGVRLRIAGKVEVYRHAFIATVRHGHTGVFERKGRERLPIRELYGPSVKGIMGRTDVLPRIAEAMGVRLVANLMRQIDRRARRDAGTHRRAA
jgi:Prophage minor tail protein Z (GPZ)